MALGAGGVSGVGIGQSVQKMKYLPFVNTDFIFAVLGEEIGLVGGLIVLALFLGILKDGLVLQGVNANYLLLYLGLAIIIAMTVNIYVQRARRGHGSG